MLLMSFSLGVRFRKGLTYHLRSIARRLKDHRPADFHNWGTWGATQAVKEESSARA
jgi:hypothetical protein